MYKFASVEEQVRALWRDCYLKIHGETPAYLPESLWRRIETYKRCMEVLEIDYTSRQVASALFTDWVCVHGKDHV